MPPPKGYVKIAYPRKCEKCDYVSNNPSMHHYHSNTHKPIPMGRLCDHGCGQQATTLGTGGIYSCCATAQHCPGYLSEHSKRVTAQWADPISDNRRANYKIDQMNTVEAKAKMKAALKRKWGDFTPEQMKDRRHYARRIRARAQKWAREQGFTLGKHTYHVDHKLSIFDAWNLGLSEAIVNHPCNLQILEATANSSKGAKSSLTVEELLLLIDESVHMNLLARNDCR